MPAKNGSEQAFHTLLLDLVAGLLQNYLIQYNGEADTGRCDLMLITKWIVGQQASSQYAAPTTMLAKAKSSTSIIIELKLAKTRDELAAQAQLAIKQIKDKQYMVAIQALVVNGDVSCSNQVHLLGLAFCGKEVVIESEFINL